MKLERGLAGGKGRPEKTIKSNKIKWEKKRGRDSPGSKRQEGSEKTQPKVC